MKDSNLQVCNRYWVLDGLRGVAALMVMCYHIGEAFATSPVDQTFNHGYLAVDFFFLLSGFVMGKAYDERMSDGKLTVGGFFCRRLIRLHPMMILGAIFGFITFAISGFLKWDGSTVSIGQAAMALFCSILLIPAYSGAIYEVRGYGEMFPLNGPTWSLFFEYLGCVLYAFLLRRLSTRMLFCVVLLSAIGLSVYALSNASGFYHIGVGWTLADLNFVGGLLRLSFGFSAGLFLSRIYKPQHIKGSFWICSVCIILLLSLPYLGAVVCVLNALYDIVCTIVLFPLLLFVGASAATNECGLRQGVYNWLGRLSYPVYIMHYPLMYLFYGWVWTKGYSFQQCLPTTILVIAVSILIAYLSLRFYDEPLQRYFISKQRS